MMWERQGHGVAVDKIDALQERVLPCEGELCYRRIDAGNRDGFALFDDQLREFTLPLRCRAGGCLRVVGH